MRLATQALFLHDRLITGAFDEEGQEALQCDIQRRRRTSFTERDAHIGALQDAAARLLEDARELSVAGVEGDVEPGELVSLTQDLYIRRASEEEGRFRAKLDTDRQILVEGRFSRSWLVGSTGRSESFGHSRLTMLAYVGEVDLGALPPHIELRPVFFGWRLQASDSTWAPLDDLRVTWPNQIDQFAMIRGKRASAANRALVGRMPERDVKRAFAEIVGEPYVEKDWAGETSDLFTDRLSIAGEPISAAFAFKGPGVSGTLHIAGMGKRGDQAIRLATEPADVLVVQHHAAIGADVRNLLAALARRYAKRYMVIDGEITALILREYGQLPPAPCSPRT
jgi:hypothetical protein